MFVKIICDNILLRSMPKNLTVKIRGSKFAFVLDTATYFEFIDKICEVAKVSPDKTVKLINKGKIVTVDNFDTVESDAVLLAYECLKEISNNETDLNTDMNTDKNTEEKTYTFDQIKTSFIFFLGFLNQSGRIHISDEQLLVSEIIYNKQINNVLNELLKKSNDILETISTSDSIYIKIVTDDASDEISLSQINITDASDVNHGLDQFNSSQLEQLSKTNLSIDEYESFNPSLINFTPFDMMIIINIANMGYYPTMVAFVYVKHDRNKERTEEFLRLNIKPEIPKNS